MPPAVSAGERAPRRYGSGAWPATNRTSAPRLTRAAPARQTAPTMGGKSYTARAGDPFERVTVPARHVRRPVRSGTRRAPPHHDRHRILDRAERRLDRGHEFEA